MEKCIFVRYSAGYKEWQFYNPASRKFIISEKAEFNKRYFPGIKTLLMNFILLPTIFNSVNSGNMPNLRRDGIVKILTSSSTISNTMVQISIPKYHSQSLLLVPSASSLPPNTSPLPPSPQLSPATSLLLQAAPPSSTPSFALRHPKRIT
jgi:hypothetical protein